MKRGLVVARRRFWNKYGNHISNGLLAFSIVLFCGIFALTMYGNPFETKEANASSNVTSETKEIVYVEGNTITTIDNMTYIFENAEEKTKEFSKEDVSLELLVVNDNPINVIAVYK